MDREKDRIMAFLRNNDYEIIDDNLDGTYLSYGKEGLLGIDIGKNEIVIIGGDGDCANLPLNIYALLGYLLQHKQIAINYKWYL